MDTKDNRVTAPAAAGSSRRSFFVGAIYAIWGTIGAALGLPAAGYLLLAPKTRANDDWIEVGDAGSLQVEQPSVVAFRRSRTDGWKVVSEKGTAWLVKSRAGSITAFGPQCTHLGCAHHWDEARSLFVCPCHDSLFAMDGRIVGGPAPRPLDRYDVKVEGGKLLLGELRQVERAV